MSIVIQKVNHLPDWRDPGPWRVIDYGAWPISIFGQDEDGKSIDIARVLYSRGNARLISRAPNLLDVAKRAMTVLAKGYPPANMICDLEEEIGLAEGTLEYADTEEEE